MPPSDDRIIDRISVNEREIGVIQKENEIQTRLSLKFEQTLERFQTLIESINRLIVVHDERIRSQDKDIISIRDDMSREIEKLENRITRDHEALSKKLNDTEARIMEKLGELQEEWKLEKTRKETFAEKVHSVTSKVENWKWFFVGGIFVAGMLLGDKFGILKFISNIFKIP